MSESLPLGGPKQKLILRKGGSHEGLGYQANPVPLGDRRVRFLFEKTIRVALRPVEGIKGSE